MTRVGSRVSVVEQNKEANNSPFMELFRASKDIGQLAWIIVKPSATFGGTIGALAGIATQWLRNILSNSCHNQTFKSYATGYAIKATIGFSAMTVITSLSFFGYVLVSKDKPKEVFVLNKPARQII